MALGSSTYLLYKRPPPGATQFLLAEDPHPLQKSSPLVIRELSRGSRNSRMSPLELENVLAILAAVGVLDWKFEHVRLGKVSSEHPLTFGCFFQLPAWNVKF